MVKTPSKLKARSAMKAIKDDVVRMRVSAEQKRAFVAAADREGLELSQWLRILALRATGLLPATQGK
jgi:antitoxin component of RelBE/YafQ-DinJ toxin-antitoxin module